MDSSFESKVLTLKLIYSHIGKFDNPILYSSVKMLPLFPLENLTLCREIARFFPRNGLAERSRTVEGCGRRCYCDEAEGFIDILLGNIAFEILENAEN